jgi:hypothetical protein
MQKLLLTSFVFILLASTANAQGPGVQRRTSLLNLEQAKAREGTKAGQIGLTDSQGDQRYSQYVEINPTPVAYTPTATGNPSANYSEFVEAPGGDIWYIDWQGRGVLLEAEACDQDWLQISDNSCPDNINDSIYHYQYASIGARYVWPQAEFLVTDSTLMGLQVISGNRNARLALYDNQNGTWAFLDQGGSDATLMLQRDNDFVVKSSTATAPQSAGALVNHFAVNTSDSTIQAHRYSSTRPADTATLNNVAYWDANGVFRKRPTSDLPSPAVAANRIVYGTGSSIAGDADYQYVAAENVVKHVGPPISGSTKKTAHSITIPVTSSFSGRYFPIMKWRLDDSDFNLYGTDSLLFGFSEELVTGFAFRHRGGATSGTGFGVEMMDDGDFGVIMSDDSTFGRSTYFSAISGSASDGVFLSQRHRTATGLYHAVGATAADGYHYKYPNGGIANGYGGSAAGLFFSGNDTTGNTVLFGAQSNNLTAGNNDYVGWVSGQFKSGASDYRMRRVSTPIMTALRQVLYSGGNQSLFDWIRVNMKDQDTTGNYISFYNNRYTFPNAAPGSGTKIMQWASGTPSFVNIPTGTIGGSIVNEQVAVGSGTNTVSGSSNLTYSSGALIADGASAGGGSFVPKITAKTTQGSSSTVRIGFEEPSTTANYPRIYFNSNATASALVNSGFVNQLNGVNQWFFGMSNDGQYGGTAGNANSRYVGYYDYVSAAWRYGFTGSGDLYVGPSTTTYGMKIQQATSGTNWTFLASGQAQAHKYTSSSAFPGTAVASLYTDASGNIITGTANVIIKGSATIDFASTAAGAATDVAFTLTGAADGDVISLGTPNSVTTSGGMYFAWVSAADNVTIRFLNTTGSPIDPGSATFKVTVTK